MKDGGTIGYFERDTDSIFAMEKIKDRKCFSKMNKEDLYMTFNPEIEQNLSVNLR